MNNNPYLSIIIPIYNREKTIEFCLNSILNQSYDSFEIIIINDCSTDKTIEILKKIQKKTKQKIKIISNKKNLGAGESRNIGIKNTTGDYICFVDSDDYIDNNYLESLINFAVKNNSDIVVSGYKKIREKDKKIIYKLVPKESLWQAYSLTAICSKLYRTSLIKKNNIFFPRYLIGEDMSFNIRAYSYAKQINILPIAGYNYTYNLSSTTTSLLNKEANSENCIILCEDLIKIIKTDHKISKDLIEYFFIRLVVFYLLYFCKKCNYQQFLNIDNSLFIWLQKNFPNYSKNKNLSIFLPKGEKMSNSLCILIYIILNSMPKKIKKIIFSFYLKNEIS